MKFILSRSAQLEHDTSIAEPLIIPIFVALDTGVDVTKLFSASVSGEKISTSLNSW